MKILGIDNVFFAVGDMTRALAFYKEIGFKLKYRMDALDVSVLAIGSEAPNLILKKENISVSNPSPVRARLFVEIPDVKEAVQELEAKGINLNGKPLRLPAGWLVEISDPWGNVIGFADHVIQPEYGRLKRSKKTMMKKKRPKK